MFSFVGETKTIIASMSLNEIKTQGLRRQNYCFNATETVPALRIRIFTTFKIANIFPISWNTMLPCMMRTENNKKAHFHDIQTVTV